MCETKWLNSVRGLRPWGLKEGSKPRCKQPYLRWPACLLPHCSEGAQSSRRQKNHSPKMCPHFLYNRRYMRRHFFSFKSSKFLSGLDREGGTVSLRVTDGKPKEAHSLQSHVNNKGGVIKIVWSCYKVQNLEGWHSQRDFSLYFQDFKT